MAAAPYCKADISSGSINARPVELEQYADPYFANYLDSDEQETDPALCSLSTPLCGVDSLAELKLDRLNIKPVKLIKRIQKPHTEAHVSIPLAQLLTAISLSTSSDDGAVLAFIATPDNVIKSSEGRSLKPDLVAIVVSSAVARKILVDPGGLKYPRDSVTAYDVQAPVEAKKTAPAPSQCLRYIMSVHAHRPQAIVCHGLSATKDYIMLRSIGLSSRHDGEKIYWTDKVKAANLLRLFIELLRQEKTDTALALQTVLAPSLSQSSSSPPARGPCSPSGASSTNARTGASRTSPSGATQTSPGGCTSSSSRGRSAASGGAKPQSCAGSTAWDPFRASCG